MSRKEKDYQTELRGSFNHYLTANNKHGLWWKIPDVGFCQKPYDSWAVVDGTFYAMEQKINKAVKTFNFKTFFRDRAHELECLKDVELSGGKAYVTINHFIPRKINKVYAMRISVAIRAYDKDSIKLDDITNHPGVIEIPRFKNKFNKWIWDLSVIFDNGL